MGTRWVEPVWRWCAAAAWLAGSCVMLHGPAAAADATNDAAGWYARDNGLAWIVSPSAQGGYRLIDPSDWTSDWLKPLDDGRYEWRENKRPSDRRVTFDDGALQWDTGAETGRATRMMDAPYTIRVAQYENDGVRLVANLMQPPSEAPLPAIVMIHGSGNSDRDNLWYYLVAHRLVERGFAVLFPDKRGCGQSEGDWQTANLRDYAADTLAGVQALRAMPGIGPVGVLGVSQGGAVAPLAATMDPQVAFVVDLSGSVVTLGEQVAHEIAQDLMRDGHRDAVEPAMELLALAQRYIRTGEGWDDYSRRLEELSHGRQRAATYGFVRTQHNWYWDWWREVIDVDPIDSWRQLEMPCLIVYGGDDEHDNVPVKRSADRIAAELGGKANIVLKIYAGTGHALMDAERGGLRRDFLNDLAAWLREASGDPGK